MDQHERRTDDDIPTRMPERIELIDRRRPSPPEDQHGPYPDMVPPHRMPRRSRKKLALGLFLATCASTAFVGIGVFGLTGGIAYSASIMGILLAHEMGHYLQARRYRVPASLPYFIPMPISFFGTMGAVIVQQGLPDRKQWFDIAISGPLAGLVLALPLMYVGVQNSEINDIPANAHGPIFGNPPILEWVVTKVHRPLGPGEDIDLTPTLFAAWVGVFITALNLIPIGQLDGGHILYCLIGRRAHLVALVVLWGLSVTCSSPATTRTCRSLSFSSCSARCTRRPPTIACRSAGRGSFWAG